MTDIDIYDAGTLAIRTANAVLWTIICVDLLRRGTPALAAIRRLASTVLLLGMWVFVIGALVQFGVPGEVARFVYTAFAAYAGIIALAIVGERKDWG